MYNLYLMGAGWSKAQFDVGNRKSNGNSIFGYTLAHLKLISSQDCCYGVTTLENAALKFKVLTILSNGNSVQIKVKVTGS